jgi:pilus assembly protein CpaB
MAPTTRHGRSSFLNRGYRERLIVVLGGGALLAIVLVVALVMTLRTHENKASHQEDTFASYEAEEQGIDETLSIALLAPEVEVAQGTKLADVRLKTVTWPKNQVPEGAVTDLGELANLYAKIKLPAGLPIQRKHTATEQEQPRFNTIPLTPGNRAVSIEVDDTSGLEGHALPGSRVDVVLTHTQNGNLTSSIIVQNARVLSYGGDTTPGSVIVKERRPSRVMRTITLDVATQDALKIQTARQMGRLSLMLRSEEDEGAATTTQFTGQDLQQDKGAKKAAPPQNACARGKMRIGGKDYMLGCDGSMNPVAQE